jgi:Domain of unknown function (DUF222)
MAIEAMDGGDRSEGVPENPDDPSTWRRPEGWEPPVPDAVDLVVETTSLISIVTAQQLDRIEGMRRFALADASRHGFALTEVIDRSVRLELACALSITETAAGALIGQADALINRYPAAFDSLAGAKITPRHATILVDGLDGVEAEFHERLVPAAVELAETHAVGTFRRKLAALIETVRASTLTERHERALANRRVVLEKHDHGMSFLGLFVPTVEAHASYARLTAMTKLIKKIPGEKRTLDQIRADIAGDLLIDGHTDQHPTETRGIRATVVVTVPALALLATDNPDGSGGSSGSTGSGARAVVAPVASVEGIGPIPFERARELCGGTKDWMRVLTHPETGIVLSVGRERYAPPADLRRLVKWRAETCMAPGCNVPASRCEVDHNTAWQDGGQTRLNNLCPFCKGHHTVKHHGLWCVHQIEGSGGSVMWTSPTGRTYRVEPERRIPTFRIGNADPPPF